MVYLVGHGALGEWQLPRRVQVLATIVSGARSKNLRSDVLLQGLDHLPREPLGRRLLRRLHDYSRKMQDQQTEMGKLLYHAPTKMGWNEKLANY